jgi:hypothetical protein
MSIMCKADFNIGDNVVNAEFGEGIIRALKPNEKVFVEFKDKCDNKTNFHWVKIENVNKNT